jgi:putative phosphoesterase
MRIAVISDIHGNALALEAVLADLSNEQFDQGVCLGDAVQGGAQPAEVVSILRDLGWPVVIGNADDWLLTGEDTGHEGPATTWMRSVRDWSLSKLSESDRQFIRAFRPVVELPLPNATTLRCAHGTPASFHDIILPETPDDEVRTLLRPLDAAILCGGHTHIQQIRRLGESIFFNPGSVALPFRRDTADSPPKVYGWAEYAMLTASADSRLRIEFRQVPYDINRLVTTIRTSGMPESESLAGRYPTPG